MTDGIANFKTGTIAMAVGQAAVETTLSFEANWFQAAQANGRFNISFDGGPFIPCRANQTFYVTFRKFSVAFTSSVPAAFQMNYLVGLGVAPDLPPRADQVASIIVPGDTNCGAGASTQVLAAKMTAVKCHLCIPAGEANGLRLGTSFVSATQGLYLPVGVPWSLTGTTDIWAYNPGAGTVKLSQLSENV